MSERCERHQVSDCEFRGPCGDAAFLLPVAEAVAESNRRTPSAYWADSWYPWLERGWCKCTCGLFFHTGAKATAAVKHDQHIRETINHAPARPRAAGAP